MHKLPQAFDRLTTFRFHLSLILSLLPVVAVAAVLQGWRVLVTVALAMGTAWGAEMLLRHLRRVRSPQDLSTPLWGLLLALLLPVNAPFYLPVFGSLFAVLFVKGLLGGGSAPWINPVLVSWAFLQVGWGTLFPDAALGVPSPQTTFDGLATEWLNTNLFSWLSIQVPSGYVDLVLGLGRPESSIIVESASVFLLLATVYLLAKGTLPGAVPAFFFLAFGLPMVLLGGDTLVQVFSGTFLLNLFFLATDPSSRPLGRWSLVVYGTAAGFLAFLLRTWGQGADGVGYAVLLMNLVVPWIDQRFRRKALNDFRLA